MATEVTFENKEVMDFLKNLDKKLKNIKDGNKKYTTLLSSIVYKDINQHFEKEEGSQGPWVEWSLSYAMTIAGRGAFRKIRGRTIFLDEYQVDEYGIKPPRKPGMKLQDTGRLRNSFKPTNVRRTNEGFLWFNNAKTKSGFPYAFAHNEGGGSLPKRDFMWLSNEAQEKISVQTLQFMIEMGV